MAKQYKIRWREQDNSNLRKAVKNYNAKISRLEKKDPAIAGKLPERVTMKEMREIIKTRNDLKREINSLRRFTQRGAEELVDVPGNEYNTQITKWAKKDMSMRAAIVNRKRAARKAELESFEMESRGEDLGYTVGEFGMGEQDKQELEPINPFPKKASNAGLKKKHKTLRKGSRETYYDERDQLLKDNFIKSIEDNFGKSDRREKIIAEIQKMDAKEFYRKFKSDANKFETSYPKTDEETDEYLTALESTWLPDKGPSS